MAKVKRLPEEVANQIAAGEVIERPASVIKELVENSIDAGSTRIEVAVEGAGLKLLEVVDNGEGMEEADALMAMERHATSKIHSTKDLFRIQTLGFRGEALPSIASVSRMELTTCTAAEKGGVRLVVEASRVVQVEQVAAPRGTKIQVRDLFYNTPARLKYLKSSQTELAHIQDHLSRLALAHPTIAIRYRQEGRTLFATQGKGELLEVLHTLYGLQTAKKMIPVQGEHPDFSLRGYISAPEAARSNRQYMTFVVNGRVVKNPLLYAALMRSYHTLLPVKRFPIAVLHIQTDPQLLDANVHPAKLEVRFSKEQVLADWLMDTVQRALRRQPLIPAPRIAEKRRSPDQVQAQLRFMMPVTDKEDFAPSPPEPPYSAREEQSEQRPLQIRESGQVRLLELQPEPHSCAVENQPKHGSEAAVPGTEEGFPALHPVAQVLGTYILAQNERGLYLIDQHAAQERLYYERFSQQMNREKVVKQPLLIPYTLQLNKQDAQRLEESLERLEELGLEVEPFGEGTFLVRAYPNWIEPSQESYWIEEMLSSVFRLRHRPQTAEIREQAVMSMACKAAIKANQFLSHQEMEKLLESLRTAQNPYTCPHGRPVMVHLSAYEIEKMFKRVM